MKEKDPPVDRMSTSVLREEVKLSQLFFKDVKKTEKDFVNKSCCGYMSLSIGNWENWQQREQNLGLVD